MAYPMSFEMVSEKVTKELPQFVTQPHNVDKVDNVGEPVLHAELRKLNSTFAYLVLSCGEQSVRIIVTPQEVSKLEEMGVKVGNGGVSW